MASKVEYVHYPAGVRITRLPDARGYYRLRYADGGRPAEARFR
ncbi:MAG: hypothetical protein RLZZ272_112 [Actinomycetota bacterium]|jgi:hypothetical protein